MLLFNTHALTTITVNIEDEPTGIQSHRKKACIAALVIINSTSNITGLYTILMGTLIMYMIQLIVVCGYYCCVVTVIHCEK